jgi:hypothetical protein
MVKEKGYLLQNTLFRASVAQLLLDLATARIRLYEAVKNGFPSCIKQYIEFENEIKAWNIKQLIESAVYGDASR